MTSTAPLASPVNSAATAPPPRVPRVKSPPPTIADVVAQRRRRLDGWSPVRIAAFLAALGETGSVTRAAEYAGMSTTACYTLRHHVGGAPFAEAWDNAVASRFEILTELAMTRIREGTEKIRWWKGEKVGTDWVFSDRLLLAMIDRADPSRRSANDTGRRSVGDAGPRRGGASIMAEREAARRGITGRDAASALGAAAGDDARQDAAARQLDPVWDSIGEPEAPLRGLLTTVLGAAGDGDDFSGAGSDRAGARTGAAAGAADFDAGSGQTDMADDGHDDAADAAAAFAEDHLRPLSDDERAAIAKPGTAFDDGVDYLDAEMRAAVDEQRITIAARVAAAAAMQAEIDARFAEFLGPNKLDPNKLGPPK